MPRLAVSNVPPAGMTATWIDGLVMQAMSESVDCRPRVTPVRSKLLLFFMMTVMRAVSPASAKTSWSPFTSPTFTARTVRPA